jgi:hypothetical protein
MWVGCRRASEVLCSLCFEHSILLNAGILNTVLGYFFAFIWLGCRA